ncbi:hypothetical protein ACP4OV_022197 [Aristida adscensionis]
MDPRSSHPVASPKDKDKAAMKRLGYNGEGGSKENQAWKKSKINQEAKMIVGQSSNLKIRHSMNFASLLDMIPQKKHKVYPEGMLELLQSTSYCTHLYLEWDEAKDMYFLWGTLSPEKAVIKFEYCGGIEELSHKLSAKNPHLAFSSSFDQNFLWRLVKKFLHQYFGHGGVDVEVSNHDYLYAFTKSDDLIHIRVFKLNGLLEMQQICPSFVLKPLATYHLTESDEGVKEYVMGNLFLDTRKLMFERKGNLHLQPQQMFPHEVTQLEAKVMIPAPADPSEWIGFNTSCNEFFDMYDVSRVNPVPGTGLDPTPWPQGDPTPNANIAATYESSTVSMRIFSTSLIQSVHETHAMNCCLGIFTEDNIFLRGGKIAILNVELVQYETEKAKQNFQCVYNVIYLRLKNCGPLPDASFALELLKKDPFEITYGGRYHYRIFKLHADKQVQIGRLLPEFQLWQDKYESNWLLYDCLVSKKAQIGPKETIQSWKEKLIKKRRNQALKRSGLLTDPNDHIDLQASIEYAGGIRNSYTHLWESGRKKKVGDMSPDQVDTVVSSQFVEACCELQQLVPKELKGTDSEFSSYKGFSRYFPLQKSGFPSPPRVSVPVPAVRLT